jgi:hypothetical protein
MSLEASSFLQPKTRRIPERSRLDNDFDELGNRGGEGTGEVAFMFGGYKEIKSGLGLLVCVWTGIRTAVLLTV